jgi:hypothetical protein
MTYNMKKRDDFLQEEELIFFLYNTGYPFYFFSNIAAYPLSSMADVNHNFLPLLHSPLYIDLASIV